MARPLPSAPVPPRMPTTGSMSVMGSGQLHLRERKHAHACGFQSLPHPTRGDHRRRLVTVNAEAVDLAWQVLAVARDDLLVEHHAHDAVLDLLGVVQHGAWDLPRSQVAIVVVEPVAETLSRQRQ